MHFKAKDDLDRDFNAYLKVVSQYMAALDAAVQRSPATNLQNLDVLTLALNEGYAGVLSRIRSELSEVEHESQSFM